MVRVGCLNCGSTQVLRTGDSFKCGQCGHEWTVQDEQDNAIYLWASQGRKPAQSAAATLEEALETAVNGDDDARPIEETGTVEPAKDEQEDDERDSSGKSSGSSKSRRSSSRSK